MKTTPEGLTHLVNMLVDVVSLQRKAQGTPGACCEVHLEVHDHKVMVRIDAVIDAAAPLTTLSADNNQPTIDEMVAAQREAIARARMAETDEPAA